MTDTSEALLKAGQDFPGANAAWSQPHPLLTELAAGYAAWMADHGTQGGHSGFQRRYDRILAELALSAAEITAESWPWQSATAPTGSGRHEATSTLAEIGTEMWRCWSQSPGHWSVASKPHWYIGAAMAKSKRGIWYACCIVAD